MNERTQEPMHVRGGYLLERFERCLAPHDTMCALCSRPLDAGTEASQWFGQQLVHVECIDPCADLRGL